MTTPSPGNAPGLPDALSRLDEEIARMQGLIAALSVMGSDLGSIALHESWIRLCRDGACAVIEAASERMKSLRTAFAEAQQGIEPEDRA